MSRFRRIRILLCVGAAISFSEVGAQDQIPSRDYHIGISLGSPLGLSVQFNMDSLSAVQASMEVQVENPFVFQMDYVFKKGGLFRLEPEYGRLYVYYGPGMRFETGEREINPFGPYRTINNGRVALRFPVGLQYYIPRMPFDLFYEFGPMLSLWPSTNPDLTLALGFRFNF